MAFLYYQPRRAGRALTLLSLTGLCAASVVPAHAGLSITTLANFTGGGVGNNGRNPYAGVTFDSGGNLFGTTLGGGTSGNGTVYEIAKGSSSLTTLANFDYANGQEPYGGVTFDGSGNLFGTTTLGGAIGPGTVYEIAKGSSSITTLASFDYTTGADPRAGVTFDSSGNLFGATPGGGTAGYGTVYEIAKGSSSITTLASFTGLDAGTNGGRAYGGVTFDSSSNLFGTTAYGGTAGYGTVYEIAKGSSSLTTLASFDHANGGDPESGVTFDSSGNLFGTTYGGGAIGYGTVYEIAKGSSSIITLASFNGSAPGSNGAFPEAGVTFDSSGNLFGTTVGGAYNGNGTVYEIAKGSSSIITLASFTGSGAGTNGAYPSGGVTFDSSGNLYGTTRDGGITGYGTVYEIAGAGSPSAVPEVSSVVSFAALLGLGGLVLCTRKRRQNATPGA